MSNEGYEQRFIYLDREVAELKAKVDLLSEGQTALSVSQAEFKSNLSNLNTRTKEIAQDIKAIHAILTENRKEETTWLKGWVKTLAMILIGSMSGAAGVKAVDAMMDEEPPAIKQSVGEP